MNLQVINKNVDDNTLQLSSITINEDYRKEWNIYENDFVCLTKNGELINNSLFRVGGLGGREDMKKGRYFLLLKYVEAFYDKKILDMCKSTDPKHLEGRWCIVSKDGIVKVEFEYNTTPYLTSDSCIYSINSNYYNIETGEHYGYSNKSIDSKEFLFLDNKYEKDKSKQGVMKINKKDGTFELFK